jgi:hypothetical protein
MLSMFSLLLQDRFPPLHCDRERALATAWLQLLPAVTQLVCNATPIDYTHPEDPPSVSIEWQRLTSLSMHRSWGYCSREDCLLLSSSMPALQHLCLRNLCENSNNEEYEVAPCQWASLKALHLDACYVHIAGTLAQLNPMSSPCLQRVSGMMIMDYLPRDYTYREVQDQQQMLALQRRLGSNFNVMVSLPWKTRDFPAAYVPFCGIARLTVTHLAWDLASLPDAVQHVILSPDVEGAVPEVALLVLATLLQLHGLDAVQLWLCAGHHKHAKAMFEALSSEGVKLKYAVKGEHILERIMRQQQGSKQQQQQEEEEEEEEQQQEECCIA